MVYLEHLILRNIVILSYFDGKHNVWLRRVRGQVKKQREESGC